jgi:septum formation protein
MNNKIFLASRSPRRKELLGLILDKFDVLVPDYEEIQNEGELPKDFVLRMTKGKSDAFVTQFKDKLIKDCLFITADTIVAQGDKIFGKPLDHDDALKTLEMLNGSVHQVLTGVTIGKCVGVAGDSGQPEVVQESFVVSTDVHFRNLSKSEIEKYLSSDEPWDKAGSYGIQGKAGSFVSKIDGSYHNVVGLPVAEMVERLKKI